MQSDVELGVVHRNSDGRNPSEGSRSLLENPSSRQPDNDKKKSPTYFEVYFHPSSYSSLNALSTTPAGWKYGSAQTFRHKDSLGRVWVGPEDDRYLSAIDGRLMPLVVQATEDVLYGPGNSSWGRTQIEECTPSILRVLFSLMGGYLENGGFESTSQMVLWWIPSSLMIGLLLFIPADLGGEIRNYGRYERFKYHYWGYAKFSTNLHEIRASENTHSKPTDRQLIIGTSYRPLRPRQLCLLDKDDDIEPINIEEYEKDHGSIEYLFICYTSEQFDGPDGWDELHRIAKIATRRAGLSAYWVSCSCMPDDNELFEDVYRISDVVRGANSLVVVIGPNGNAETSSDMLRQLGKRMWTFPEILLCRANNGISIYTQGCYANDFRVLSKRNLAIEAWGDAPISRHLIDHYESSIILSPLELVSIALQCIANRDTSFFSSGDLSYVLMGLLRRRPIVDKQDSAFEAFCRLSLANDSDQLIERLVCLLPRNNNQQWHEINDFWDSNLWDIEPHCQAVGLGGDDTVIMSGAFGAPIHWGRLQPVNLQLRNSVRRLIAKVLLRSTPVWVIPGVILLAITRSRGGSYIAPTVVGWIIMGIYFFTVLLSPYLLYSLYVGKTWEAQPWLFGFEGYMEIGDIERLLFGANLGRLRWSPYSSEFSQHRAQDYRGQNDECVGIDPTGNSSTVEFLRKARNSKYGDQKIFTLIDTNTLTVTLFRAVRPPVALLLCGSEGGMERALLCSYDWKSQTLYRETVIRMDTIVLEKMARVDRFRLGLRKFVGSNGPVHDGNPS